MLNGNAMQKMENACGVQLFHMNGAIDITCKVNEVSFTPNVKYDTACTVDERFVRPWQPVCS
jgi:hypothetical protein